MPKLLLHHLIDLSLGGGNMCLWKRVVLNIYISFCLDRSWKSYLMSKLVNHQFTTALFSMIKFELVGQLEFSTQTLSRLLNLKFVQQVTPHIILSIYLYAQVEKYTLMMHYLAIHLSLTHFLVCLLLLTSANDVSLYLPTLICDLMWGAQVQEWVALFLFFFSL